MRPRAFSELGRHLAQLHDLGRARAVLAWDERTMMPAGGAAARAEQLATLSGILHERLSSDEVARLLDQLVSYEQALPYDSDEASLIRVTRREHERARRVPRELKIEIARTGSIAEHAWGEARSRSDFTLFLPHLEKIVGLKLRYVECFDEAAHPYEPLLDDFEPGMTLLEAERLFDQLRSAIMPLLAAIVERADTIDDSCLYGHFPADRQRHLALSILNELPIERDCFRLDETAHPFSTTFSRTDMRIAIRYKEDFLAHSLFSVLHEYGHALYDNGVSPALERSALSRPASLGIHESQSRIWENVLGRSLPFWRHFYPRLQDAFPAPFGDIGPERFHRAVNKVRRSLVRTEADEFTYDLHVILRFELEKEIFEGALKLRDLPEAWNARVKSYLGLDVADQAEGVLQDVHWAEGAFGYFPTYSFGNIIAGQLREALRTSLVDLDDQIANGEFQPVREWLREHVHRHGRKFTSAEILERVVGGPIDVAPYIRYLEAKADEIYALS
jgi:carboxypeptidase Taq